ncbi:hypothetical protein PQX77_021230 [Marasmius sp. AFHP31]|nr:hypothetical protein PQX77_021230 [Marasmius sp. AFHP31]
MDDDRYPPYNQRHPHPPLEGSGSQDYGRSDHSKYPHLSSPPVPEIITYNEDDYGDHYDNSTVTNLFGNTYNYRDDGTTSTHRTRESISRNVRQGHPRYPSQFHEQQTAMRQVTHNRNRYGHSFTNESHAQTVYRETHNGLSHNRADHAPASVSVAMSIMGSAQPASEWPDTYREILKLFEDMGWDRDLIKALMSECSNKPEQVLTLLESRKYPKSHKGPGRSHFKY